ncbi:MAG: Flp pilus assembly protein RcpC/CpaB [Chloroflexota bacterium]|jgi:Flp pilus assembly protein CpaB|nr:Flp pilus assembly protein RcpC/CpaB [Chloroflexota bacterium]
MVLGIIIAVVAFLLVILVGGNRGGTDNGARNSPVVVSVVDIPAGQQVSEALVKVVNFAPDQVPVGSKTTVKAAVGQYAAVALPKNSVLTSGNLVPTTASLPAAKKPYLDIPAGQVAIAIPAGGELQAVGGNLQQDDRVDIIFNPSSATKPTWKTTFQNLRIARFGGAPASGSTPASSSSLIVYVSLDDAENLSFLFANGNYKLALRSQLDATKTDVTNTAGATADSFAAKFNLPK